MKAPRFIAGKMKFKGRIAMVCIAVSFLVMIIAVAVSSGFRGAVREGISAVSGDVMIAPANLNYLTGAEPVEREPSYLPHVRDLGFVESVSPVVYRAGIVKSADVIHGVVFKGIEGYGEDGSLAVSVPERLSDILGIGEGDELPAYFVGEKTRVRKFKVAQVHDNILGNDDMLVIYANIADIQRVNLWSEGQVSAFEVMLKDGMSSDEQIREAATDVGYAVLANIADEEASVVCTSMVSSYPQLFDWLNLIDFNVLFILVLMTLVAGFNMISGLLILLFENISMIGTLKALGMNNKSIAEVFLRTSSAHVLKGMVIGNVIAFLFCLVQSTTGVLTLDPANYFVSQVPVRLDVWKILLSDALAYIVIMLMLLIPSLFIAKVDPAKTVTVR